MINNVIPNFGNNGYVQPKTNFDWSIVWFIIGAIAVCTILYFVTKKEEKKEYIPPIEPPKDNSPYQVQTA